MFAMEFWSCPGGSNSKDLWPRVPEDALSLLARVLLLIQAEAFSFQVSGSSVCSSGPGPLSYGQCGIEVWGQMRNRVELLKVKSLS